MAYVLPMAAFQLSHPVVLVVLMKANNVTLHHVPAKDLCLSLQPATALTLSIIVKHA
jgi:hypothetical protein